MNNESLKDLKGKLNINNVKELNQEQFNNLINNLSYLDQNTVRMVIRQIPNLSGKVFNYFQTYNRAFELGSNKDFLQASLVQQKILLSLLDRVEESKRRDKREKADEYVPKDSRTKAEQIDIRDRIADELLEHSKWIRKEASETSLFKKGMLILGGAAVFGLLKGVSDFISKIPEVSKVPEDYYRYKNKKGNSGFDWDTDNTNTDRGGFDWGNSNHRRRNSFDWDTKNDWNTKSDDWDTKKNNDNGFSWDFDNNKRNKPSSNNDFDFSFNNNPKRTEKSDWDMNSNGNTKDKKISNNNFDWGRDTDNNLNSASIKSKMLNRKNDRNNDFNF